MSKAKSASVYYLRYLMRPNILAYEIREVPTYLQILLVACSSEIGSTLYSGLRCLGLRKLPLVDFADTCLFCTLLIFGL